MQRLNCSLKELKFAPGGTDAKQMTFSGYGAVFGNVDAYVWREGGALRHP